MNAFIHSFIINIIHVMLECCKSDQPSIIIIFNVRTDLSLHKAFLTGDVTPAHASRFKHRSPAESPSLRASPLPHSPTALQAPPPLP